MSDIKTAPTVIAAPSETATVGIDSVPQELLGNFMSSVGTIEGLKASSLTGSVLRDAAQRELFDRFPVVTSGNPTHQDRDNTAYDFVQQIPEFRDSTDSNILYFVRSMHMLDEEIEDG